MASITERIYKSGKTAYRVRIRLKGLPGFCLTFDDWDEACQWVEQNEDLFIKDPLKYLKWKQVNHTRMIRERHTVHSHIVRTKIRRSSI